MILTCSNPGLELAVLGNPGRKIKYDWQGVPKTHRKSLYQLAERWAKRKSGDGPYTGKVIGVRKYPTKPRKVVGHPRTGRVGTVDFISKHTHRVVGTNPMRRFNRYITKLNPLPAVGSIVSDVKALPSDLKAIAAKPIKGVAGALGGAAIALGGGAKVMPFVNRGINALPIQVQTILTGEIGKRVISALVAYGLGKVVSKYAPVGPDVKRSIEAGAVAAALMEALFPGKAGQFLADNIPVVGQTVFGPASSVQGLGIYTGPILPYDSNGKASIASTPSSRPLGSYSQAPGYSGSFNAGAAVNGLPGMGEIIDARGYTPNLANGQTPIQEAYANSGSQHFLAHSFMDA